MNLENGGSGTSNEALARHTLASLGFNVTLHEELPRAAAEIETGMQRLSDEGVGRIADEVVERLLSQHMEHLVSEQGAEKSAEDRRRWRDGLRRSMRDLGINLTASGLWGLLVYLSQHVHLMAPEDDPGLRQREARRRAIRAALLSPLDHELRSDLEADVWLYKQWLGPAVEEDGIGRLKGVEGTADFWALLDSDQRSSFEHFWAREAFRDLFYSLQSATIASLPARDG